MPITHERGYVIPAVGKIYEDCANRLRDSILHWHPNAQVTVVTKEMLPHGDQGGFANDWQMFGISPYRQTIKLEADMIAAGPVDHWWTLFEHRDVVVSQGCRDFYNNRAVARNYRKLFDENNLPDLYNAITYWRVSKTAKDFFDLVRNIFENWNHWKTLIKYPEQEPSTDVVYSMAAVVLGVETVCLPLDLGPKIVHMKKHIAPLVGNDWTKELIWEIVDHGLRINTVAQHGFVHYHIKDFVKEL